MLWRNRQHAARELARMLKEYKDKPDTLVLGIPRGGVVLASVIAAELNLPLDVIITRKIGAPGNEELAIGAIDEYGEGVFNEMLIQYSGVTVDYLSKETEKQKEEIRRRLELYRQNRPPLFLGNKNVILADDGIATGSTMLAAVHSCRVKGAGSAIVAAPVVARNALTNLEETADQVIYLEAPVNFAAVGQFYEQFMQVSDEEVIRILQKH